ncbi:MAG: glycerol-3-phosphate dehydrogenase [Kofleriaceae bacterium]|nr:glycerol-3-phosphate dehydrogenase [Myxococcales bacterium]MCB9563350.1 glycerol-3-phosphate dehydrogenase [Kofleriaceae bacterium]MCB9573640.1 glycerol-3-phosphate dehydrogenase [Kofleriaceae bacterium]
MTAPTSRQLTDDSPYDLVIIGGGITGAGIARDAVLRGMKVAVFEKGDFGSGTSSKSSKLIHGGLRYLEHGEIGLVFESVSERRVQTRVAPHLVRPQAFLVPIYKSQKPGLELMNLGLWIYDSLALFRAPRMHKTFRGARATELEPEIKSDGLKGIIEYYDCATDDARLVLENVLDARAQGAVCRSYTQVVRIEREDGPGTRIRGVTVKDLLTGEEETVACRAVVLAAGAWTDEMVDRFELPLGRRLLRRTKGVHLVLPRDRLPVSRAITLISHVDGRVMFVIPWRGRTVVGTTDTDFEGTADEVWADDEDVAYLCRSVNEYFPRAEITPADVIATWAGLRPLIRGDEGEDESEVSREHEVFVRDDGMLIIAGGKLTTYRRMAKEVVRAAVKWLRGHDDGFAERELDRAGTKQRPLPGAQGLEEPTLEAVAAIGQRLMDTYGIDADDATHLCGVYGVRAELIGQAIAADRSLGRRLDPEAPYLWAEVDFAVAHDLARTVEDVLARRAPLLLVGRDQGLDVCDEVARRMQTLLGWSDDERARHVATYQQEVADSRRFRA